MRDGFLLSGRSACSELSRSGDFIISMDDRDGMSTECDEAFRV